MRLFEVLQAIRLTRLPKYFRDGKDPMAPYVPERGTHTFALHPDKWEATFYSLTLRGRSKLSYYLPTYIDITPDTIVADMLYANRFHTAEDDEERQEAVEKYRQSMKPINQANLTDYRLPELLIPPNS